MAMPTSTILLMLLGPAVAVAAPLRIAVLEFRNPAGLAEQEVDYITDLARGAALRLPSNRFFVMTRENILQQLPPGTDLGACIGECEVETGRNVGADFVLTGEVIRFGASLRASMKLHDTKTGRLLGSERASGARVDALEAPVEKAAARLFARVAGGGAGAAGPAGAIGEQPQAWEPAAKDQVIVPFASEPSGAVVLVDGQVACRDTREGCSRNLSPGPHAVSMQLEHHETRTEQVVIKAGLKVEWRLSPTFALLSVESEPAGLQVTLDGKPVGKTPLRGHRVTPGLREVLVKSACHFDKGERVQLARGERKSLSVELKPREAGVQVTAEDGSGNAVEATVKVDGTPVGKAPSTFTVPVCSKRIEVRAPAGEWSAELSLRERETARIAARLVGASSKPKAVVRPEASPFDRDPRLEDDAQARLLLAREQKLSGARLRQIRQMRSILKKNPYYKRKADLLFRIAEKEWDEAKYAHWQARARWQRAGRRGQPPAADFSKAIATYQRVLKEFPSYRRIDEVMFYLGRGLGTAGQKKKGASLMLRLTKDFPKSKYLTAAHLAVAEYYFEADLLYAAKTNYLKVLENQKSRHASYAAYKLGYVHYNLREFDEALKLLDRAGSFAGSGDAATRFKAQIAAARALVCKETTNPSCPR